MLMGRKKTTSVAEKYFEETKLASTTTASGFTVSSRCKCCHADPFLGLNGTKKVAHLLGISGAGVSACRQSRIKIPKDDFEALASSTKSAREWRERGAGGSHPLLNNREHTDRDHTCTDGDGKPHTCTHCAHSSLGC